MTLNQNEIAIRLANGEKLKPKGCERYCEFDSNNYPFFPFRYVETSKNVTMEGIWKNTEWETYRPLPDLKVDDKVSVRMTDGDWCPRHFKKFIKDGKIITYAYGKTSWTTADTVIWDEWKESK